VVQLETLAPARARAASRLLEQYLIRCPGCGLPAAVHVDLAEADAPTLVRVVCPERCELADDVVLALVPVPTGEPLSA